MEHFEKNTSSLDYNNQPMKHVIQGISTMYYWRLGTHIKEEPLHVIPHSGTKKIIYKKLTSILQLLQTSL